MGMVSGTAAGWNGHKERKRRIQAESGQAAVCTDSICPFLHTGWRPFDEYYNFCTRMSMFNEERIFFKAWLDEENRIVSFHEIPGSRYYSAEKHDFWQMIVSLILAGYRVQ